MESNLPFPELHNCGFVSGNFWNIWKHNLCLLVLHV